jgi:hypothetical protein
MPQLQDCKICCMIFEQGEALSHFYTEVSAYLSVMFQTNGIRCVGFIVKVHPRTGHEGPEGE